MFGLYKIRGAIEGGVIEREKQGKKSRWGMGSRREEGAYRVGEWE